MENNQTKKENLIFSFIPPAYLGIITSFRDEVNWGIEKEAENTSWPKLPTY